jgi:condensin complex subunit 3
MLRSSLLDRVRDKESSVRVQAVIALSKLSASEDPADVTEDGSAINDVLTDTLVYDPAAYVYSFLLQIIAAD